MKKIISEQFDVLVIGGGPAGLMAAARAAEKGARVALVEKNDRYGIKLLMSGNGRCNVTQDEDDPVKLAQAYHGGRFLISAFNMFSPSDLRAFLSDQGVATKVEKNGRVFPISNQAKDVLEALYEYLRNRNVTFFNTEEVTDIITDGDRIAKVVTRKKEISAANYIIAVGGKSYPQTGSSGDGYAWAAKLGHMVIDPRPVLVPMKVREDWIGDLQGVSAHSVGISILRNGKKIAFAEGDVMFAHFGLSGPAVLNLSRDLAGVSTADFLKINLDFKPLLTEEKLDGIIRRDFEKNASKNLSNCLTDLFSPKLLEFLLAKSGLDPNKHAANISRQERLRLVKIFKGLELTMENLFGFDKAMVTRGGVSTKEIDSRTMRSRLFANLFFAGEILDVDGPTGGYNLQMCWSTGYVAGQSAS